MDGEILSSQGKTVSRNARPGDPAVKIARDGVRAFPISSHHDMTNAPSSGQNDVVKLAHELNEVKDSAESES